MKKLLCALALVLTGLFGGASVARADATVCTGTLNGYFDSVVVPSSSSCTLNLATIAHDVDVASGATLTVVGQSVGPTPIAVTIGGNLHADRCTSVLLDGSLGGIAVGGDFTITKCTQQSGFVGPGVTIKGNFTCANNSAPCEADNGTVLGNVTISNSTSPTASDVSNDIIGGNLTCRQNTVEPTDKGGVDFIGGSGSTQCGSAFIASAAPSNCSGAINLARVPGLTALYVQEVAASGTTPQYCQMVGVVQTEKLDSHQDGDRADRDDNDPMLSSAGFLLRLPATWNNRFVFMGCGGSCGSIGTRSATTGIVTPSLSVNGVDSGEALGLGYAVVNTDTGHEQIAGSNLPQWSVLNVGVPNQAGLDDFNFRSVHQVTLATKELVSKYYKADINYAYFDGCSTGGRQAMVAADNYPEDFDGIIAGDPIMDLDNIRGSNFKALASWLAPGAFIDNTTIANLDAAVLANCDALDGVVDGLIQNPQLCSLDPNTLVPSVLTQAQATGVQTYIEQVLDTKGRFVYPGFALGHWSTAGFAAFQNFNNAPAPNPSDPQPWSATGAQITTGSIPGPVEWSLADPGVRYYTEANPQFDSFHQWPQGANIGQPANIESADAVKLSKERVGSGNGDNPKKLKTFIKQNRKLILYHGFSDNLAPPFRTVWFYRELAQQEDSYANAQENVRLFMVPGMGHCSGGTSPNTFDTLQTLVSWVEDGTAPDALPATNTSSGNAMPLCKFPEVAAYLGGPTTAASSWKCDPNDQRLLNAPGMDGVIAGLSHNGAPGH
jgi:feruloyl esterase